MGDKPQSPDSPNYMPILQMQAQQAARAMNLMETQWGEITRLQRKNEPIQDKVTAMAVERMERLDNWAVQDRQRYQQTYVPIEERFAKQAMEYDSPVRREAEAGKAMAGLAQQFEIARDAALGKLEKYGVDPSHARYGALNDQASIAKAAATAAAGNQARDRIEQMGLALKQQAIANGRNLVAQGMSEDQLAGSAAGQAVGTGIAGMSAYSQSAGTPVQWFQQGAGQTNAQGDLMARMYEADINKYKAETAADQGSGFGGLIGQIAGLGLRGFGGMGKVGAATGGAIPDGTGYLGYDEGGDIRGGAGGGYVPAEMSPTGGAIPDDIDAQIDGGGEAKLNAGEFVFPKDVMEWKGQEWAQKEIMKARKQMNDPNAAPAQPTMGPENLPAGMSAPPGGPPPGPPPGAPPAGPPMMAAGGKVPRLSYDQVFRGMGGDPKRTGVSSSEPNAETGGVGPDYWYIEAGRPGPGISEGPFTPGPGYRKQQRRYVSGGAIPTPMG